MKNITETLSGRISIIQLSGLSLRETQHDSFQQHFLPTMDYILERQKTTKAPNNIWEIIHKGSYPKLQNKETEWTAFYSNYVKTYLEQDVRELSAEQNLDVFRHFMISAAARTGEVLNYSTIVIEIGKDATTVKNWISILETSGIIYLLEPYTAIVLKRAIRTTKLYSRDTGLTCYLTRWLPPDTLAYGDFNGHIFETFVISEILNFFPVPGLPLFCLLLPGKIRKR